MFKKHGITVFARLYQMAEPDVPPTAVIGISTRENIHERIDGNVINIAQSMGKYFHFGTVGPYPDDATPQHGQLRPLPVNRPVKSEISHGDVYPTINPHANSIGSMIGTAALEKFG